MWQWFIKKLTDDLPDWWMSYYCRSELVFDKLHFAFRCQCDVPDGRSCKCLCSVFNGKSAADVQSTPLSVIRNAAKVHLSQIRNNHLYDSSAHSSFYFDERDLPIMSYITNVAVITKSLCYHNRTVLHDRHSNMSSYQGNVSPIIMVESHLRYGYGGGHWDALLSIPPIKSSPNTSALPTWHNFLLTVAP